MKKSLSLILAAAALLVLVSCGVQNDPDAAGAGTGAGDREPPVPLNMDLLIDTLVKDHPDGSAASLCDALLENPYFRLYERVSTDYDYPGLKYGYKPEGTAECACIVDYITGSGSFVYVFTPSSQSKAQILADKLKENVNTEWMFSEDDVKCDKVFSKTAGGKVFLAFYSGSMTPVTGTVAEKARDFVGMFREYAGANENASCYEIAKYLASHQKMTQMGVYSVEEGRIKGIGSFEKEAELRGFSEGVIFEPVMSPNQFIGYVFRLPAGADMNAFEAELTEKSNLAWNVCVVANTKISDIQGDLILFMMCSEKK